MLKQVRERLGGAGLIVAVAALVVALGGAPTRPGGLGRQGDRLGQGQGQARTDRPTWSQGRHRSGRPDSVRSVAPERPAPKAPPAPLEPPV